MDIYLFGAGQNCRWIVKKIEKNFSEINIKGVIDNNKNGEIEGYRVIKLQDADINSIIVITLVSPSKVVEVYYQLRDAGYEKVYWCQGFSSNNKNNFLKDECIDTSKWGRLVFPDIELHISDKCNLNCKGCTHFSPLYKEVNVNFEDRINDVKLVLNKFTGVARLDILGGEPLVNSELDKYVVELRKMLPNTFIQIFTNGLLIPKLSDETLKTIYDNNVAFSITEYKPTVALINQIKEKLNMYAISYYIVPYDERQKFNKPLSVKSDSKYPRLCISDGCIAVADGMVAKCPTLMYVVKVNETFGTDFPTQGIIRLDSDLSGEQLLDELKKEVPLCKHCIKCDMEWGVCGREPKLEDFVELD